MEDDVVAVAAELAHDLAVLELQLDRGHAAQPASELQRVEELRLEAAVLGLGDERGAHLRGAKLLEGVGEEARAAEQEELVVLARDDVSEVVLAGGRNQLGQARA